jgi:hypothetical protein
VATPEGDRAEVDLVVGLATEAPAGREAGRLVQDVAASLRAEPGLRWRVVLASTGEADKGLERLRAAIGDAGEVAGVTYGLQPSDALDVPYHGMPGRARALHALLQDAQERGARACVVIDPRGAAPGVRLGHLARPLLDDTADYVAPVYSRHPVTGALVHGLLYPMFRALYGARLRYPLGTDAGCSRRLIDAVVADPIWGSGPGQVGVDLWLSSTAASSGLRVAQASVGPPPEERAGLDLGSTVSQLVGYFFADMEKRVTYWQRVRGSRATAQTGEALPAPAPPAIDVAAVADSFRLGSRELQDVWAEVLPPAAILQWRRLAAAALADFRVDDGLWARTVYDFAVGHRQRVIARDHLLRALTPLYLGWLASFILQVQHAPEPEGNARIEQLCLAFEAEKPYRISQWRWPERFKPVKMRR